jgi:hypothetical protein
VVIHTLVVVDSRSMVLSHIGMVDTVPCIDLMDQLVPNHCHSVAMVVPISINNIHFTYSPIWNVFFSLALCALDPMRRPSANEKICRYFLQIFLFLISVKLQLLTLKNT